MSDLVSMLVPLQTMPGWPDVENPSIVFWLFLMVILPVATMLVVFLVGHGPRLVRAARGEQITTDERHWLGSGAAPKALSGTGESAAGGTSERW